ncbi:MAG: galactitol-1-phosphate 5-dehydrogenase [Algisphaera sp.]
MSTSPTMPAVVLHGISDLRYEQLPIPALRPGTVRVKIAHCGVCGSDMPRCFSKGTYNFPTVCGHEFSGTVEALADDVTDYALGDRVVVFPLLWNDDHPACEQGQYAQSDGYDYLGSRSDGGFAEFVIAPTRNLIRVPDNVPLDVAAMTEPAAVALHAARRAEVRLGDVCAVIGLGPIGLMLAQWLRAMGASRVHLFDVVPDRLDLAKSLGFTDVHDSKTADPAKVLHDSTGNRGAHVVFEAAGVPATMLAALASVRRAGRVVLLGNPSADVTLPATLLSQIMRREAQLLGTWNSIYSVHGDDDDWRATLDAMSSGTLDLAPLITHRVPLTKGIDALEMMRDRKGFFVKVLLHPDA